MTRKKLLMLIGSVCLALVLAVPVIVGCAAPTPTTPTPTPTPTPTIEVIHWRMFQALSAYNREPWHQRVWYPPWGYEQVAAKILEESDGRLDIRVCLAPELGFKGDELPRVLGEGELEISEIILAYLAASDPWQAIWDLPYIINEPIQHEKLLTALYPYFEEYFSEYDITMLTIVRNSYLGEYLSFYTKKPITTVEDLKGLKIRVMSPYHVGTLEKAGVSPVFMPASEMSMAMATGVVDGTMTAIGAGDIIKSYETGHIYETACWPYANTSPIVVSNKAFNELPADLKKILVDAFAWFKNEQDAHNYNALFSEEMLEVDRSFGMVIAGPQPELWDLLREYAKETDWVTYKEKGGAKAVEVLDTALEVLGRTGE